MKTSGTELEKSHSRAGTLSLCCQWGLSTQAEFPELGSFWFPLRPTMLCEISAGTGSGHCSFFALCAKRFPKSLKWTLVQEDEPLRWLTTRSAHRNPHVLGKQKYTGADDRTLCEHDKFHLLSGWHSLRHIRNYFSLKHTPRAVGCAVCEQILLTKITVSRNCTSLYCTDFWSDAVL